MIKHLSFPYAFGSGIPYSSFTVKSKGKRQLSSYSLTDHTMLNEAERYEVVKVFRICSIVGQFPNQVDLNRWQLKPPSRKQKATAVLAYIFLVLQALYQIGSLAFAVLFVPDVPLHQILIHISLALPASMMVYWYYSLYFRDPSLFAAYFNTALRGNVGGPLGPQDKLKKHWKIRIGEYSMQDWIATSMPYLVPLAVPTIIAAFVYDPSMRVLLYAALPDRLQNWATFGLSLLCELWVLLMAISIGLPVWQLQVISFDLVINQLQSLIRNIQNGTRSARSVYRNLRSLQLYVSMTNNVNRYLIFTWKLMSIALCILNGYAAVAHFAEYPIFGIMYYVFFFDVTMIYTFMYGKAFKIPQLFEKATACTLFHMRGYRPEIFTRQIRSISPTGIKVGNFHTIERVSTLIFINFVVTNIVSMLVAYR